MHVVAAALLLACSKPAEEQPRGAGHTDIFGSVAQDATATPEDAGARAQEPEDAGAEEEEDAGACTLADGGSACPMLRFMKNELTDAYAAKNQAAIAAALGRLAKQAPADYTNWRSICDDAAKAAKAGAWPAVKAACRSCHQQYKSQYIAAHRGEALR